jgi:hypothetical protein
MSECAACEKECRELSLVECPYCRCSFCEYCVTSCADGTICIYCYEEPLGDMLGEPQGDYELILRLESRIEALEKQLTKANERIADMLEGDDGQAYDEAEKYLAEALDIPIGVPMMSTESMKAHLKVLRGNEYTLVTSEDIMGNILRNS